MRVYAYSNRQLKSRSLQHDPVDHLDFCACRVGRAVYTTLKFQASSVVLLATLSSAPAFNTNCHEHMLYRALCSVTRRDKCSVAICQSDFASYQMISRRVCMCHRLPYIRTLRSIAIASQKYVEHLLHRHLVSAKTLNLNYLPAEPSLQRYAHVCTSCWLRQSASPCLSAFPSLNGCMGF